MDAWAKDVRGHAYSRRRSRIERYSGRTVVRPRVVWTVGPRVVCEFQRDDKTWSCHCFYKSVQVHIDGLKTDLKSFSRIWTSPTQHGMGFVSLFIVRDPNCTPIQSKEDNMFKPLAKTSLQFGRGLHAKGSKPKTIGKENLAQGNLRDWNLFG